MITMKTHFKLVFLIILFSAGFICGQPILPQRTITVSATQNLSFGLFFDASGNGGTITVDWQGIRTNTGGIYPIPSSAVSPAIFEIKLCQGRTVNIMYPESTTLTDSNGFSLRLDIGPTEKGASGAIFATENNCNFITLLRVGGTLHIPPNAPFNSARPFDSFTGSFPIYFEQQ